MKISPEHLEHMEKEINKVRAANPDSEQYYRSQELTPKRYRWDCMYAAGLSRWVCDELYPIGVNDTHIDTALRSIFNHGKDQGWPQADVQ